MILRVLSGSVAAAFMVLGFSGAAWAACTSPAGQPGDVIYANNFNALAYCDGTDWTNTSGLNVSVGGSTNTPGGADTYVQYNSGGTAFGGSSGFTWNNATSTLTATNIAATGLTATTVTATTIAGTLSTAAQPNITSVGTLTGLTVNGVASATNVYAGNVSGTNGSFATLTVGGVAVTGGSSGDRIASGTTVSSQMVMNGGSTYVSLSTGATTWGYLSSATSWIPSLGANTISSSQVSATNVSVTTGEYSASTVNSVVGGGGNMILSGTTVVSVTNSAAKGYAIGFANNGTTAMVISGTNVGIGTASPGMLLSVSGTASFGRQIGFNQANGTTLDFVVGRDYSSNNGHNFYIYDSVNTAPRFFIDSSGNVGIGTTAPAVPLDIASTVNTLSVTGYGVLTSSGTTSYFGGNSLAGLYSLRTSGRIMAGGEIDVTSDGRLKNVDFDIAPAVALGLVDRLRPVSFQWKASPGKHTLGFIAQDVEKVIPNAVTGTKTERFADERHMDYNQIVAVSVAAIQQLKAENDGLKAENASLKADIKALTTRLDKLEAGRR